MAQYSQLIITDRGKAALSELMSGEGALTFTRISASDTVYPVSALSSLTGLSGERQSSAVSRVERSGSTVTAEGSFTNENVSAGFYIRTLGLYAACGDDEFLFAAAAETAGGCYIPPYDGRSVSGAVVTLAAAISDAANISLETTAGAWATVNDIRRLENALDAHDASPDAHGAIRAELLRLEGEVGLLKLKYATNITANSFSITFDTLSGLSVSGVHNTQRGTIDF